MDFRSSDWTDISQAFQQIWGYDAFRPPQGEIVQSLLRSEDALIVMPTGSGKSVCFQLPALLKQGLSLVISPLVALMENQVKDLQQRQLQAALLHSELPREERKRTLKAIAFQELRLLYLSPETLLSPPVWKILSSPDLKINALILDEAHCLLQWGETFRPEYRRLGAVRPALLKFKPPCTKIAIAAFTATADATTQAAIASVLQLQAPQVFRLSPYRPNLHLQVNIAWTPQCRRQQLLRFIETHKQQSGLVYVRSRFESEVLAQTLQSLNYSTASYHAGLSPPQRRHLESNWLAGKTQFVVCTSAFGMGIDKSDVRWIVHFHPPLLLSEYLQEVGRGGRDGKPTEALMLISEPSGWLDASDKQRQIFFHTRLQKQYQQAQQLARQIPAQGNMIQISQEFPGIAIALSLLHSANQLEWLDPFHYRLKSGNFTQALAKLGQRQQHLYSPMTKYLTTRQCRWQFLLQAFGFSQEATGWKCGHCDNCQKPH